MVGKQELSSGKCLLTFRKPWGSRWWVYWRMVSHKGDMPSSNGLERSSRFFDLSLYVLAVYINHKAHSIIPDFTK